MRQSPEKELDIFELEAAIKWANAASLMDTNPEVSYMFTLSETALKEKLERLKSHQPSNEPLTLSELREMDGEPVWCEKFGWRICYRVTDFRGYQCMETGVGSCIHLDDYGKNWLAYRRKPEEGTWQQ